MISIAHIWIWLGIAACVAQSAVFSGLNLAVFSLSQLRLRLEADGGNAADAARLLELHKNSNQLLATIIWGDVSTTVLLTLLSDSVLAKLCGRTGGVCSVTIGEKTGSRQEVKHEGCSHPFIRRPGGSGL